MATAEPGSLSAIPFGMKEKLAYAAGYIGVALLTFVVTSFLPAFYIPPVGTPLISAGLFAAAMIISRICDGLADPLSGYLSDTARTRLGRRRPFMLVFGPLAGIFFALLFPHVAAGAEVSFAYFLVVLIGYYFCYTMAVTPYFALLTEVARTEQARLNVTTYMTFFNYLGIAAAMVLGAQVRTDPWAPWWLGAAGGFTLMLPGLVLREPPRPPRAPSEQAPSLVGMFAELGVALRNRLFVIFVLSQLCLWFGFNMILGWMPYLVERILRGSGTTIPYLTTIGSALILLPVAFRIAAELKVVKALVFAMAGLALGFVVLAQLGGLPAPPIDLERILEKRAEHGEPVERAELARQFAPAELAGDPATPNQRWRAGLITLGCLGLPLAIFFITPKVILADLIDRDKAARGGEGREGMYFAAQAVVIQVGGSASGAVLSLLVTSGGEAATVEGIARVGPVAGVIVVVGMFILEYFRRELQRQPALARGGHGL